jgi:hypothetical protein
MGIQMINGMTLFGIVMLVASGVNASASDIESTLRETTTIWVNGSYPKSYMPLPQEGLAFLLFAPDGNHRALHSLRPSGEVPETVATLQSEADLVALSDKYLIVRSRRRFLVYDRQSGRLLARKMFANFPGWASGGTWVNGDSMITAPVLTNDIGAEIFEPRRIHLPDLVVLESYRTDSKGSLLRWGEDFVNVAATRPVSGEAALQISVLDDHFHLLKQTNIGVKKNSCEYPYRAEPVAEGDLLAISFECGVLQVYSLRDLALVAEWIPPEATQIHDLAASAKYVHAVYHHTGGGATITTFALRTLKFIRTDSVPGYEVIVSGDVVYSISRNVSTGGGSSAVQIMIYRIPEVVAESYSHK